jgi:hypothetical protein
MRATPFATPRCDSSVYIPCVQPIRYNSRRRSRTLDIVTLDERLAAAARKEGFMVVDLPPAA